MCKQKAILFLSLHPYFCVALCPVSSQPLAERYIKSYGFSSVFQGIKGLVHITQVRPAKKHKDRGKVPIFLACSSLAPSQLTEAPGLSRDRGRR
jgi:hypothetical protein